MNIINVNPLNGMCEPHFTKVLLPFVRRPIED